MISLKFHIKITLNSVNNNLYKNFISQYYLKVVMLSLKFKPKLISYQY